ncbi:MAG: AarF/ABC1/UbiB kinase family protein [Chloroflexota bacterium]|nr:MAG: AarF/ABC1/UbiB kinase family protein [Chloroflexota bacterium]
MRAKHLRHGPIHRYRQVVRILFRHGFGYLVDQVGLGHLVPFHWGLLGHRRRPMPYSQAEHLRLAFEELGATFIKLGQILSTRSDILPPDFIAELSKLQDAVPPERADVIESQIASELGRPPSSAFAEFDPEPLGSASIGQVHAAKLGTGEEVVVKVQRPGVEHLIEADLAILMDLARLAQARTTWGQIYDLPGMVEEFAETLRGEMDYVSEGRNADRIRGNFTEEPALHVPTIHWNCTTRRILTMERIEGTKISDIPALEAAGIDRQRLAATGVRIVLKMMLEDGFFHADPHPGNFLVQPGEVIGLLDYGMVGRLDERTRENLLYLFLAIMDQDMDRAVDQLSTLGVVGTTPQLERLKRDLERLLSLYWGLPLQEIDVRRILEEFLATARRHQLHVPAHLALLSKTLSMHEGLARQLDPTINLAEMLGPYARKLVWRTYRPDRWARRVLPAMLDLSQLMITLPRRIDRLLGQVERGNVSLNMRVQETEHALDTLNRMVNRLILGVLATGFIVGIPLLLQVYHATGLHQAIGVLLGAGFAVVAALAFWLIFAILHRGHH